MARIELYVGDNFEEPKLELTDNCASLHTKPFGDTDNWADRTSSVKVLAGDWILYQDHNYENDRWLVSSEGGPDPNKKGEYRSYKHWVSLITGQTGKNDSVSSVAIAKRIG